MTLLDKIKKIYHKYILRKKYYRYGKCAKCGACCRSIYIRHKNDVIKTKEEFDEIKNNDGYSFYQHVEIVGSDKFGLIFKCLKYDENTKTCLDHKHRPSICRNYPSEEIFSFGAQLNEDCGYSFEPIEKFSEVFEKVNKNSPKEFEILN